MRSEIGMAERNCNIKNVDLKIFLASQFSNSERNGFPLITLF